MLQLVDLLRKGKNNDSSWFNKSTKTVTPTVHILEALTSEIMD